MTKLRVYDIVWESVRRGLVAGLKKGHSEYGKTFDPRMEVKPEVAPLLVLADDENILPIITTCILSELQEVMVIPEVGLVESND